MYLQELFDGCVIVVLLGCIVHGQTYLNVRRTQYFGHQTTYCMTLRTASVCSNHITQYLLIFLERLLMFVNICKLPHPPVKICRNKLVPTHIPQYTQSPSKKTFGILPKHADFLLAGYYVYYWNLFCYLIHFTIYANT